MMPYIMVTPIPNGNINAFSLQLTIRSLKAQKTLTHWIPTPSEQIIYFVKCLALENNNNKIIYVFKQVSLFLLPEHQDTNTVRTSSSSCVILYYGSVIKCYVCHLCSCSHCCFVSFLGY